MVGPWDADEVEEESQVMGCPREWLKRSTPGNKTGCDSSSLDVWTAEVETEPVSGRCKSLEGKAREDRYVDVWRYRSLPN